MDYRVRAHGAAAGADAQDHHACGVRAAALPAVYVAWADAGGVLSGVDVSPIVWVALTSFLNEILVGKQGLLVLLAQKVA